MGMIVCLHGGGAPGVSTTVAALASQWPRPVLAVEADPNGGSLTAGWLASWWTNGDLRGDRSVVSFAASTRKLESVPAEGLVGHIQNVLGAAHVRVLAGVGNRAQAAAVGPPGWRRLASALRDLTVEQGPDVLVDAGRWCAQTPWPLVDEADQVLVGLRPTVAHLAATQQLLGAVDDGVPTERLGLIMVAGDAQDAAEAALTLGGLPRAIVAPHDPLGARAFSHPRGTARRHGAPGRSALLRACRRASRHLADGPHTDHRARAHPAALASFHSRTRTRTTGGIR